MVYHVTDSNKDTGFVSTIGMLSTIAAIVSFFSPHLSDSSLQAFFDESSLKKLFNSAKLEAERRFSEMKSRFSDISRRHIVALGSGWAWPALVDFDSKITEGAISSVEISESKNYTHGRYLNAYKHKSSRLFVLFSTGRDKRLTGFLEGRFSKDFPVFVLQTDNIGPIASVELMVKQLYLTNVLAKSRGLDIVKPSFPLEARGLYSWGPIYRYTERDSESDE